MDRRFIHYKRLPNKTFPGVYDIEDFPPCHFPRLIQPRFSFNIVKERFPPIGNELSKRERKWMIFGSLLIRHTYRNSYIGICVCV